MKTVTIPANQMLFFIGAFLLTISVEGLHPTETKPSSSSRRSTVLDDCKDSPFPFKVVGRKGFKDCNWVASRLDKRCPIDGVSLMCAKTCDECLQLEESHLKFKFYTKNDVLRRKTCRFVTKKKTNRCEIPGMRDTCRVTCNDFTAITPSPSVPPTPKPSVEAVSSRPPSTHPSLNKSWSWEQIGQDIDGEDAVDLSGQSVALSGDGRVAAVGAHLNDGYYSNSWHVSVYQNVNGLWVQVGQDIDVENAIDYYVSSVALSDDGSVVAVGVVGNNGNGSNPGHVCVYQNVNGSWEQIGKFIDGENAGDESGRSVALSDDGSVVAVGATENDGNGSGSGHVRIFELK